MNTANESDHATDTPGERSPRATRRLALGLAAGTAAGAFVRGRTVAAVDGEPVLQGVNNKATNSTQLGYEDSLPNGGSRTHVFAVQDGSWPVSVPASGNDQETGRRASIAAFAGNDAMNGFYGITTAGNLGAAGGRFFGEGPGSYGVVVAGRRASIRLQRQPGETPAPPDRFSEHNEGEITFDDQNDLWFCVESGRPGVWRRVSGPATAGALVPITPVRVLDSRITAIPSSGLLTPGSTRAVSVAHGYDATGARVASDAIPAGATAVIANITSVGQSGGGFLSVVPGGVTSTATSTVNWGGGAAVANSLTSGIDANRIVNVINGPSSSTHVIIDVTGYYR